MILRQETTRLRPEARVTGADPANALRESGAGEAGAVVADLSQDPRAGLVGDAGETGDDLVVGVLLERLFGGL
ncbi:hypothetical protein ACWEJ6_47855 [Nonomuraea sp. NPDC004702]